MDDREFGDALIAAGLLNADEVSKAIEDKVRAQVGARLPVFLWDLLIEKGFITRSQVDEVLASLQRRRRWCTACAMGVVAPRITADGERCGRCGGPVGWRIARQEDEARWSEETQILMDGAPRKVQSAGRDPASIFGKYVLVEEAGRGGGGVVYKAWDLFLSQHVALKFIHEGPTGDKLRRTDQIKDLIQEARNAIRLRHPNIVPVLDAGRVGTEFYICMEYIEGTTLSDRHHAARAQGAISALHADAPGTLAILRDVALAAHYAHTLPRPIVHCDLKPANILIDRTGQPFIVDFGLAQQVLTAPAPEEHMLQRGTPAYMAPEQVVSEGHKIGPLTDVYALGAILYEQITGHPPFMGSVFDVLFSAANEPPPAIAAPERFAPIVPLVMKCLAKSSSARPESAKVVADELESVARTLRADQEKAAR